MSVLSVLELLCLCLEMDYSWCAVCIVWCVKCWCVQCVWRIVWCRVFMHESSPVKLSRHIRNSIQSRVKTIVSIPVCDRASPGLFIPLVEIGQCP